MKDLKHLYYFEKLLEDANNKLVRQAQAEGKYLMRVWFTWRII